MRSALISLLVFLALTGRVEAQVLLPWDTTEGSDPQHLLLHFSGFPEDDTTLKRLAVDVDGTRIKQERVRVAQSRTAPPPDDVVVVVQRSFNLAGSSEPLITAIESSVGKLADTLLSSEGTGRRMGLIFYDHDVIEAVPLTNNRASIQPQLANLTKEPPAGQLRLYDAFNRGILHALDQGGGGRRQAVLVISDGFDRDGGESRFAELARTAHRKGVLVYFVVYLPQEMPLVILSGLERWAVLHKANTAAAVGAAVHAFRLGLSKETPVRIDLDLTRPHKLSLVRPRQDLPRIEQATPVIQQAMPIFDTPRRNLLVGVVLLLTLGIGISLLRLRLKRSEPPAVGAPPTGAARPRPWAPFFKKRAPETTSWLFCLEPFVHEWNIEEFPFSLGDSANCDLWVCSPTRDEPKHHCQIVKTTSDGQTCFRLSGTPFIVYVPHGDKERADQRTTVDLVDGTQFKIGDVRLVFKTATLGSHS